jgi:S-(hydroxymethyl)glutathione dehydrogenase / alcohol dehydrogenase
MKAAVIYELGKPLVVEEVDIDPLQKGQIKIRNVASAICHSDVHMFKGESPGGDVLPLVGGHESAGIVEEVGEGVTSIKPGDHVVVSYMAYSCGHCPSCLIGLPHLCTQKPPFHKKAGGLRTKRGEPIAQGVGLNGFSEYTVAEEGMTVKIPEDMPLDRAALLTCGVATGFGAVVNRAEVRPFSSVVVIGAGGVGVNAIQGAYFSGAYPIIAVDTLDSKLQLAREFGASHGVNARTMDPCEGVQKLTEGVGADYVFVTVGNIKAMQQGYNMLKSRGMVVIVGNSSPGDVIQIPPSSFQYSEKVMTGVMIGATRFRLDIFRYITLYKAGRLKLDELITRRYSLDKINEALEVCEKGEGLRNVIIF